MTLSNTNAIALLFDVNQNIEEYAEATIENIIDKKDFDFLTYPPNCGFSDAEKEALATLNNNEHLKNALRKVIADNTAGVIFDMLNLLDGTGTPKYYHNEWTGVKLVDEEVNKKVPAFDDTLHDKFFEVYWDWRKIRGNKGWKLDTYESGIQGTT